MGIQIAGLGNWIQDGAGIGVRPLLKELNLVGIGGEHTGCYIAGKERCKVGASVHKTTLNVTLQHDVRLRKSLSKSMAVEGRDFEDSVTALRTAGTAGEVSAGARNCRLKCSVDDLDKVFRHSNTSSSVRSR